MTIQPIPTGPTVSMATAPPSAARTARAATSLRSTAAVPEDRGRGVFIRLGRSATGPRRCADSLLDDHRGAVRDDLAHGLADFRAVEAHGDHRVGAHERGVAGQPVDGVPPRFL